MTEASVVTLKHLAREFDIDPFKLRRMFRKRSGLHPKRRWRWEEGSQELKEIREWLAKSGSKTGVPQVQPETQPTPSTSGGKDDSSQRPTVLSSQPRSVSKKRSTETPSSGSTTEPFKQAAE